MKHTLQILVGAACLAAGSFVHAQLPAFNWVEIGNPGNPAANSTNAAGWGASYWSSPFPDVSGSVAQVFQMSAYETSNLQWAYFMNTVDPNGTNPNGLYTASMASQPHGGITFNSAAAAGSKYSVKSGYGLLPVVYVSWNDSARFVNWLHNGAGASSSTETGVYDMSLTTPTRMAGATYWLPNEDEWVKAAYHDPATQTYSLYPTKTDTIPTSTTPNSSNSNSANFNYAVSQTGDPSGTLRLSEVGGYTLASSFYGTYDQGGNVWEWTESINASWRGRRGGSWDVLYETFLGASSRSSTAPTYKIASVGFRVATVPEPSSALLVLLGGAAWLIKRCKKATI